MRRAVCALVALLATRGGVRADVVCSTPDTLCTGDPCVTSAVTVASPCILDFGTRALVIGGALVVPGGGTLTLTAASIQVQGTIDGSGATGATVTLGASAGPITQGARISVAGSVLPGSVTLTASGDIDIGGIIASATQASAPGGSVAVAAGGIVRLGAASRVGAKGGSAAAAGSVSIAGDAGAELAGHLETGGGHGGSVVLASSAGSITMGTDIRGKAGIGTGTTFQMNAADTITINRHVNGDGKGNGGSITITAPTVVIANQLSVKGKGGAGGTIDLHGNAVTVTGSLRAPGYTTGGRVVVVSDSAVLDDKIDVRGKAGSGGTVLAQASAGNLTAGIALRAQIGGAIQLEAPLGDLTLAGRFLTGGTGCIGLAAGGTIATGTAVLDTPVSPTCGLLP